VVVVDFVVVVGEVFGLSVYVMLLHVSLRLYG
jgi:hypothetical protein